MQSFDDKDGLEKILLKIEEVAQMLGVCRAQVYRLMATHGLPTIKLGRSRRISGTASYQWIEEQATHEE